MASRLEGLIEARRAFARIPEAHRNVINDVHAVTASEIVRNAKAKVRVKTGRLQRSITYSIDKRRGTAKTGITQEGFYGRFIEFGTVNMPARPFMMPAVEGQRGPMEQRFRDAGRSIEKDVAAVGGRFV